MAALSLYRLFIAARSSARRDNVWQCDYIVEPSVFGLLQHSMLYFFHHYELPVILQQAQLQQLLLRTHHGMGGMVGLAGMASLGSGPAYHDATATGTQATPPTTQSTTQTVHSTTQSTTQTSPSVSTVQTNTTHTGDVASPVDASRSSPDRDYTTVATNDKSSGVSNLNIEKIVRRASSESKASEGGPDAGETGTLDRRRSTSTNEDDPPLVTIGDEIVRVEPRASPEADDLD